MVNVLETVFPETLVAVTVKLVNEVTAVGVPVILPLTVLKDKPAGSVPVVKA